MRVEASREGKRAGLQRVPKPLERLQHPYSVGILDLATRERTALGPADI